MTLCQRTEHRLPGSPARVRVSLPAGFTPALGLRPRPSGALQAFTRPLGGRLGVGVSVTEIHTSSYPPEASTSPKQGESQAALRTSTRGPRSATSSAPFTPLPWAATRA